MYMLCKTVIEAYEKNEIFWYDVTLLIVYVLVAFA
jgi:hypothetical protein